MAGDAAALLLFAVIGRLNHSEGLSVAGVWDTAFPFLLGELGLSWLRAGGEEGTGLIFGWRVGHSLPLRVGSEEGTGLIFDWRVGHSLPRPPR